MTETLEWFQCKTCGRRHRWSADIAGTEVDCACGEAVVCPEVEFQADGDASDTVMDPGSTGGRRAAAARRAPDAAVEFDAGAPPVAPRTYRGSGLSPFTRALLWSIGAAIGFMLIVHAVIVQSWVYIALTVLWTPFSFLMFLKARKKWQGNRSLKRAFLEQVGADEDDDEDEG